MFTPDLTAVVADLAAQLAAVVARVTKLEAAPPPPPEPSDEAAAFLARWAPVSPSDFAAKYGLAPGQPIPPMPAYDEAEAIFRARAGYLTGGTAGPRFSRLDEMHGIVSVIARATQETAPTLYETGNGLCDPDVAAYGFLVGLFSTQSEYQKALGGGVQPRAYAGATLASLLAPNFGGGEPSGG